MIFSRKEVLVPYTGRLKLFKTKWDYEGLMSYYLHTEPHSLYNMGHFLNFIKDSNPAGNVLSIGSDPLKESILIKETTIDQIDVYDIEADTVEEANKYWKESAINVRYYCKNLLEEETDVNYDTALLFQMDYIFSDAEYSLMLKKIKQSGISDCYVITPSLFNINLNKTTPIDIFIYDICNLVFYLIRSFKLRIKRKPGLKPDQSPLVSYKRTKTHLIKLFTAHQFTIIAQKSYLNGNGSFNLFHFNLEKNGK